MEVNKKSLSPFDDKRYIMDDNITTIPFGIDSEELKQRILSEVNRNHRP